MTKMMTMYIIFERLKQGTLSLSNQFTISERAWRMQGSKMFVPIGSQVPLEDLIRGISIQSGNDACVAVAEGIAGSEEAFAKQMNDTAKKLGMENTNFTDSSGWPNPNNTTTPQDLAKLGAALIRDFPEYYHYFGEREFTFHGIRQFNRNLLLGNPSLKVDGLKTGHTDAAGYGITLSATEGNRRLLLVVNGLDSEAARAQEGERLLKWGFANFYNAAAFSMGQEIVKAPVWMGAAKEVPLTVASNVVITLPKTGAAAVKASVNYKSPIAAPITQGQEVGTLTITFADGSTKEAKLVAASDVAKLGFFARIPRALGL
jgi:D-alanyl-D-alanine carboxypeptidase (penicillin-binding protein 5/6)